MELTIEMKSRMMVRVCGNIKLVLMGLRASSGNKKFWRWMVVIAQRLDINTSDTKLCTLKMG